MNSFSISFLISYSLYLLLLFFCWNLVRRSDKKYSWFFVYILFTVRKKSICFHVHFLFAVVVVFVLVLVVVKSEIEMNFQLKEKRETNFWKRWQTKNEKNWPVDGKETTRALHLGFLRDLFDYDSDLKINWCIGPFNVTNADSKSIFEYNTEKNFYDFFFISFFFLLFYKLLVRLISWSR